MSEAQFTIGFIGAGNMATALIDGLLADGWQAQKIIASDTDAAKLEALDAKGVQVSDDNSGIISAADAVILAVKPQVMADVLVPLGETLAAKDCVLVSIAAGISLANLQGWTHSEQAIVRCMPNTPALVRKGVTALYCNPHVSEKQRHYAEAVLCAVSIVCWLQNEEEMDAVTAVSGSGPAYFFLLMESMQEAAIELGLDRATAELLCKQTALGAAELAMASDVDVAELRRRVTSPGGTTEAALKQFESEGFNAMVSRALGKAAQRSRELAAATDNSAK